MSAPEWWWRLVHMQHVTNVSEWDRRTLQQTVSLARLISWHSSALSPTPRSRAKRPPGGRCDLCLVFSPSRIVLLGRHTPIENSHRKYKRKQRGYSWVVESGRVGAPSTTTLPCSTCPASTLSLSTSVSTMSEPTPTEASRVPGLGLQPYGRVRVRVGIRVRVRVRVRV